MHAGICAMSVNVTCISSSRDCRDLSVFLQRYCLSNHPHSDRSAKKFVKSIVAFDKIVQIHLNTLEQSSALLLHLSRGNDQNGALDRLLGQTSGVLLAYSVTDSDSLKLVQAWIDALCGARGFPNSDCLYGVLLGIRPSFSVASREAGAGERVEMRVEVARREGETFAHKNNLKHFSVDLDTSSQTDINLPLDFLGTLCFSRQLYRLHQRHAERAAKFVPCFAALLGPHPAGACLLLPGQAPHMVGRAGEPHSLQARPLYCPRTHALFSPPLRRLVRLLLLTRRFGEPPPRQLPGERVSLVALLPEEVIR